MASRRGSNRGGRGPSSADGRVSDEAVNVEVTVTSAYHRRSSHNNGSSAGSGEGAAALAAAAAPPPPPRTKESQGGGRSGAVHIHVSAGDISAWSDLLVAQEPPKSKFGLKQVRGSRIGGRVKLEAGSR